MKVSYFPGCTLNTSGKGFDNAVRASSAAVGLELVELPEWNCCGATYPLIIDNMLELAAPAHVLVAARDQAASVGDTVTTACTTCYNVLKRANRFIREHEEERERINAFIEAEYAGEVEVKDILHLLRDDIGFDAVQEKVKQPLEGLKVASYYGCMVLRPPAEVAYDDPDHPTSLDDLMTALGATVTEVHEAQQATGLFVIPFVFPYWFAGAMLAHPNGPIAVGLSLFPPTALSTLSFRIAFAQVPNWQIAASATLTALCALGALWLAGRAFRLGMLRYGQRLALRELFTRAKAPSSASGGVYRE